MKKILLLAGMLCLALQPFAQTLQTKFPQTHSNVNAIVTDGSTVNTGGSFSKPGTIDQLSLPLEASGKLPEIFSTSNRQALTSVMLNGFTLNVESTPSCPYEATGTATANGVGGATPYTYLWSNGATTQSITGGAGTYSVTVTTADSISVSASVTIDELTSAPAPVITKCAEDAEVILNSNCELIVPDLLGGVVASGSCGTILMQFPEAGSVIPAAHNEVVTIQVMAIDFFENSAVCEVQLTAKDTTRPAIGLPSLANTVIQSNANSCNYTIQGQELNVELNDNCVDGVTAIYTLTGATTGTGDNLDGVILNGGTTHISVTVTDAAGNTSSVNYFVVVADLQHPVLMGVPADTTAQCSAIPAAAVVTTDDNCAGIFPVGLTEQIIPGNCAGQYTLKRTWFVTDANNNIIAASQLIQVTDTEPPVLNDVPANITVSCDQVPAAPVVTATDICSAATVDLTENSTQVADVNNAGHYNYILNRKWTATDDCGNTTEKVQTITVQDLTAPVITCPGDVTVSCEANTASTSTGGATATDACSPVTITESSTSTQNADPNNAGHYNYVITRTWRATDVSGNYSECVQTINVRDITAPVITCPGDATVNYEANMASTSTGVAIATDACSPVTITESSASTQNADPNNAGHYNYVITRTWRATDVSGNYSECVQTINVRDITAPVITCPANTTVGCGANTASNSTGAATATDVCSPVTITETSTSTQNADPNNAGHYNYVITRTWRAKDVSGNYSECVQTINVRDITAPVITCPANTTVGCGANTASNSTGAATATDVCSPVMITESSASTQNADTNNAGHYNYVITRTWRATDASGNYSECVQTINVRDITAPVITCPANNTVGCGANTASNSTGVATATDACSPVTITESSASTQNADPNNAGHYNYVITRTWRATDVSGNYSECVQKITVQDVNAPIANCKNVTVQLINGQATITAAMVNNNSTDLCGPVTLAVSKTSFTCADLGNNTVTLTVKDASGNQSTCQAVVEVVGELPSCSITAIPVDNVYTGGIPTNIYIGYGPQSATLSVNATGGAPYTYQWFGNGSLSNRNTANPVFTATAPGRYTFIVVVTSKNGCKTTCSISFFVNDIRVPGTNGKKVYVCHKPQGANQGNTLEIAVQAVKAHIGPGGHAADRLGKCDQQGCDETYIAKTKSLTNPDRVEFDAVAFPNPATNYFTLKITGTISDKPVRIKVMDLLGRTVEVMERNAGQDLKFGDKYHHGVYMVEVTQGGNKKLIKLVKAK